MLELLKELGHISEKAPNYYNTILLASPVLFVLFQQRAPAYPFWNALLAISAPGAVAGLLMWVGIFAGLLYAHYDFGLQVDVAWIFLGFSLAFPAIWFAPVSFAAALFLKRNGKVESAIFAAWAVILIVLYFSMMAVFPLN